MKTLTIVLLFIWLLFGLIAVIREYYSQKRYFWLTFKKKNDGTKLHVVIHYENKEESKW